MANRFLIVCGGSGSRLLGQRRVLGVSGELHVDVSSEIKARPEDPNSIAVRLDEQIGTVQKLLEDMERRLPKPEAQQESPSKSELLAQQSRRSTYVHNAIMHPADVAHARFLANYYPSTGFLRDGLAQAPAIGGAAIRHTRNMKELANKLRQMTTHFATNVSEANPLDVWIVSSTAGGTG